MQDTFTTAKTKVGRTKPSTGPHAARGLDIAVLDIMENTLLLIVYVPVSKKRIASNVNN